MRAKKTAAKPAKAASKSAAKASTRSAAAPEPYTNALTHGKDAYAARWLKPGFSWSEGQDLEWALGSPSYATLVRNHEADYDAGSRDAFYKAHGLINTVAWPDSIPVPLLRRFARVLNADWRKGEFAKKHPPITADEATQLAESQLHEFRSRMMLLWLEAFAGPVPVWRGVSARLARDGGALLTKDDAELGSAIYALGFIVNRLPAAEGERARQTLEDAYRSHLKAGVAPLQQPSPLRHLDVVLHGAEGSKRSGHRYGGGIISHFFLDHVVDDPAYVVATVPKNPRVTADDTFDPRLCFLGGDEVLKRYLAVWKSYDHGDFIEKAGRIRSELVLPVMLEASATSKARKKAQAWFVEHADFARDFLGQEAKGGGDRASWAAEVLKKAG